MWAVLVAKTQDSQEPPIYEVRFEGRWRTGHTEAEASDITSWQSIDVFFRLISENSQFSWPINVEDVNLFLEEADTQQHFIPQGFESAAILRFLIDCLSAARDNGESVARAIVPRSQGQIARSDIIPLRFIECSLAREFASFAKPLQFFDGKPVVLDSLHQVLLAFGSSAGGILLKPIDSTNTHETHDALLHQLDVELRNRLSFPWISKQPIKRKVLALVEGGRRRPDTGGNGETVFMAAKAMGIDMVVLDNPGHWLDGPQWAHWRKAFLPIEAGLQSDAVFTARVVNAIRAWGGHLDGIVTFCDHYTEPVAEAALQLSLPALSPATYALATDKFRLRCFEGHEAYRASSLEQATSILQEHNLEFPLIMKPITGYLSEGVVKIDDVSQLEAGVKTIRVDRHGADFAIEKYCDGPEVDANFVLSDGELLFFEASDEFPKTADVNGSGNIKNFVELGNVLPSSLPKDELAILRDSLHRSLVRMGLTDGIFHLEARVAHSRMVYELKNGVFDLTERSEPVKDVPSAWLIEVNPRPPSMMAAVGPKHTYGVDYWGLGLLFGIQDKQRAKQLSHPFAQGAQFWCEMAFIPVEKGGIFDSDDICLDLFSRRPDLAQHVSWSACYFTKGDEIPDPSTGIFTWVGHFNVFSRKSRAHVLEVAECIRKEVRYTVK
ncbi:ATP-grasp domain-containing protein [Xylariaceae sp. FL1019]|nr:ATP-grasp domain-containing protein [Xylariaceae sp. FL1019]